MNDLVFVILLLLFSFVVPFIIMFGGTLGTESAFSLITKIKCKKKQDKIEFENTVKNTVISALKEIEK